MFYSLAVLLLLSFSIPVINAKNLTRRLFNMGVLVHSLYLHLWKVLAGGKNSHILSGNSKARSEEYNYTCILPSFALWRHRQYFGSSSPVLMTKRNRQVKYFLWCPPSCLQSLHRQSYRHKSSRIKVASVSGSEIPKSAFPKGFVLNIVTSISSGRFLLFCFLHLFCLSPHTTILENNSQTATFTISLRELPSDLQLSSCQEGRGAVISWHLLTWYRSLLNCSIWLTQNPMCTAVPYKQVCKCNQRLGDRIMRFQCKTENSRK